MSHVVNQKDYKKLFDHAVTTLVLLVKADIIAKLIFYKQTTLMIFPIKPTNYQKLRCEHKCFPRQNFPKCFCIKNGHSAIIKF